MAEMEQLGIFREGRVCKNLFLRDQKGKQHFLVSLPEEKQASLKDLGEKLGVQRLSFASEERLQKYLGVTHGAVSPLGILNKETHSVTFVLDREILQWDAVGVHPNDNTATVWLSPQTLQALVNEAGNHSTLTKNPRCTAMHRGFHICQKPRASKTAPAAQQSALWWPSPSGRALFRSRRSEGPSEAPS